MITKSDVITGIKAKLVSGFNGWDLDGFKITIPDGNYPNAVVNEIGQNYPAICIRDGGDPEFISHGGNSYYVTSEFEIFCYANSDGITDASNALAKIEDKIIDIFETSPNIEGETTVLIQRINRGYRNDGFADLYSVGYYDGVAISSVTLTVNYRRCTNG